MQNLLFIGISSHMKLDHLTGDLKVTRYRAPPDRDPLGRSIEPGREEIEFLTGGRGFFEVNGRLQPVGCGCILWHLPGEQTIYRNDRSDPYECLVLSFPVTGSPRRQAPRVSFWEDTSEALSFAREVLSAYHRDGIDRVVLARYAYARLFWQAHVYSTRRPAEELPRKLQLAIERLNRRDEPKASLSDVAEAAGVSVPHLHHLFRRHLQTTPHQYLLQRCLQEARHLLASTDLPIKEVSYRSGFRDPVNFGRQFKARFGTTASAYRARHTGPRALGGEYGK